MDDPLKARYVVAFNVSSGDEEQVYIFTAVNVSYTDIDANIEPDAEARKIAKLLGATTGSGSVRVQSLGSVDIQEMHGAMDDIDKFIDVYGSGQMTPTPDILITDMATDEEAKITSMITEAGGNTVIIQRPLLRSIGGSTAEVQTSAPGADNPCSIFSIQLLFTAEVITKRY